MSANADEDHTALRFAAAHEAALCTLVGIDGSFSRRLGAQLAIARDGRAMGSLADGCLERELALQADSARKEGKARMVRYGRGSPYIDFRLPCGSGLDILIDPSPARADLIAAVAALDARRPAILRLASMTGCLLRERKFVPELRLLVLGSGLEAAALLRLATAYGIQVEVTGPEQGLALGQIPQIAADAWTAIVLLFHDHEWEREVLAWALATEAPYIGALGGRTAREERQAWLRHTGLNAAAIDRVRSPVGLISCARDARVLALSVLAEVVAQYEDRRI